MIGFYKNILWRNFMRKITTIIIMLMLILAGCGSSTLKQSSANPNISKFKVAGDYQNVYRDLLEKTVNCFARSAIPMLRPGSYVDGNLYPDIKEGHITVSSDFCELFVVQIRNDGDQGTLVVSYYKTDRWLKRISPVIMDWVQNNIDKCPELKGPI